ncbi:Dabb family protein [Serratia marcescens]|nr:Dabb family protein [Serratia marcescens]MBH3063801.1 Dabb family protein [Serratia marcescens]NCJ12116.1 Dabb family protein [Serratia marcescens]NDJ04672.1 Dabb family protein [Serratia marcescens]
MLISISGYADEVFNTLLQKKKEIGAKAFTEHHYNPGVIKHIVIFRYKHGIMKEQKKDVARKFLQLQSSTRLGDKDPYIISIVTGSQNSGEKASMGFEQAFIVTFGSEGDRNYYVGTPVVNDPVYYDQNHAEFKKFVEPLLAEKNGVLVFDFRIDDQKNR